MERLAVLTAITILVLLTAYLFQLWARHHRRLMIHRERLAALEKGVELPPLVEEIQRRSFNVQRLLLLAGLCWVSVGVALFVTLDELAGGPAIQLPWGSEWSTGHPIWIDVQVRPGVRWLAFAPIGIGLSHLIVYLTGRRQE